MGRDIVELSKGAEATSETMVRALKLTDEKLDLVKNMDIRLSLSDALIDARDLAYGAQKFGLPAKDLNGLITSYQKSALFYAQKFGDRHLHKFPQG